MLSFFFGFHFLFILFSCTDNKWNEIRKTLAETIINCGWFFIPPPPLSEQEEIQSSGITLYVIARASITYCRYLLTRIRSWTKKSPEVDGNGRLLFG